METRDSHPSRSDLARVWLVPCLTLVMVAVGIAYAWLMWSQPFDGDSQHYIDIANGHIAEVHKPFTMRLLHPVIAGLLSRTTGVQVETAFFLTNVVSLAVLTWVGLTLVFGQIRSLGLAAAIVLCPMVLFRFRETFMPDLLHAAIAAVFFLLLVRKKWWYAMPLLFFMQVTRESTVLLSAFVVLVAAYHRNWKIVGSAILFTLLGIGVVGRYAGEGQGNVHGASSLVYFVGKIPLNALPNVFGIRIWTNTHAKNDPKTYPDEPLAKWDLPAWLPSGDMHQVGIYRFEPTTPLTNLRVLLTFFGVMPSLIIYVLVWKRWHLLRDDGLSQVAQLALLYGLASYVLSPALGTAFGRYVFYAWPMAWVAAPEMLVRFFDTNTRFIRQLAWAQAIACWTPLILNTVPPGTALQNLISVAVAIPCHVIALKLLNRNRIA
jgi:hypothetical protein